jgi:hypothetical protein
MKTGGTIGPYEIPAPIGEGGMSKITYGKQEGASSHCRPNVRQSRSVIGMFRLQDRRL